MSTEEAIRKIGKINGCKCRDASKAATNDPHRATFRGAKKKTRNTAVAYELMGANKETGRLRTTAEAWALH